MLNELKILEDKEGDDTVEQLPEELAKWFISGMKVDGLSIIKERPENITYQLYEREEPVPGLDLSRLRVEYRQSHEPSIENPHLIRFNYLQVDPENLDVQRAVAQMFLGIIDSNSFELVHRYVDPAYRNHSGVGTRLLKTAEEWVAQVADELDHPITIRLKTGQESVIKWILKLGYAVKEDQRAILEEINEHPERFLQDEVFVSEESRGDGIVKDLYTFRIGTQGRYMEDAIRLTFEKTIQNND